MRARATWSERWDRPGWNVCYTHLGGRFSAVNPYEGIPADKELTVERRLGQVFIASPPAVAEPSTDMAYFATVARKILQRGAMPPIPEAAAAVLTAGGVVDRALDHVLGSIIGPPTAVDLDPAFELDPTYEDPLWRRIGADPALAAAVYPQAPYSL